MLDSEPNEQQIEDIREILDVSSTADVTARIAVLTQAAWTATIADVAAWTAIRDSTDIIKGDGVIIDDSVTRLNIRNRVRTRFGYPKLGTDGQILMNWDDEYYGTQSVDVHGSW